MQKVQMYRPIQQEVDNFGAGVDGKRNALGYIYKKDLNSFVRELLTLCDAHNLTYSSYKYQNFSYPRDTRIELFNEHIIGQLNEVSKKPIPFIGLFLEEPIIGKDQAGRSITDSERLMVWVYFTINKRALTTLKRFLLNNIFDLVEKDSDLNAN